MANKWVFRIALDRRPRGFEHRQCRAARGIKSSVNVDELRGAVARLVGIEVGVVSGVFNLESPGVSALGWRLRHEEAYHAA